MRLLALALAAGCVAAPPPDTAAPDTSATTAATPAPDPAPDPAPATGPVVTLERTMCYGTCPAYTVSAFADGRVTFEGREHTARPGPAEWRVEPSAVAGLVAEAGRIGHGGYPDRLSGPDACPQEVTDSPTATTTVRTAAGAKTVVHYHGCHGFEGREALLAFEDGVDRALGTAAYVGAR